MPKGVYPHLHIKPKKYPDELVERVRTLYASGRTQTEIAAELRTSQKAIWRVMRNHDIATRTAAPRDQRGSANAYWRGGDATYAAFHKRVEVERGKPAKCSSCDTTEPQRYEWANLTGHYDDVNDYIRLCTPCHRRFDGRRREVTGRPTSPRGGDAPCP